ncbi:hypothetical protein M441DRAFT_458798, partial [Trichoderma asperellum CBS 433.97]
MLNTITKFIHGYITRHLCDRRYRMARVYGVSRADNAVSVTFSQYFEGGYKIGSIDPAEWTEPTFLELVRKQNQRQSLLMVKSLQLPSMDVTKSLPVVQ